MAGENVRLSEAKWQVLRDIAKQRPVAGNDDGWVIPFSPRSQVFSLRNMGMLERKGTGVMCGMDYHRITDAGRAALAQHGHQAEDRGAG